MNEVAKESTDIYDQYQGIKGGRVVKNVIITGANRGIGLELVKIYAKEAKVFALCRQRSDELDGLKGVTVIEDVDLRSQESINKAVQKCTGRIDLLISNAGVFHRDEGGIGNIDIESIQDHMTVNTLAPLTLIQTALYHLGSGSKVALISSRMGSITDNTSGGFYGYRMSKAALNALGKSLAVDLKPKNITVAILHPGMVKTKITGYQGQYTPEEAAVGLAKRIEALTLENTGSFVHAQGEILPW